jgi:predicted kinase
MFLVGRLHNWLMKHMQQPHLVLITGHPGTGKTTLGRYLSRELDLPFINKDGIKETLFDSVGWKDRAWSRHLGLASYDLLYYFVEALLGAGGSAVIESNFDPEIAGPKLAALQQRFDFAAVQIVCKTEGEVLLQRFKERTESSSRHPGHVDSLNYDELRDRVLNGHTAPLPLDGPVLEADTTDFNMVDYGAILSAVRACIEDDSQARGISRQRRKAEGNHLESTR